MEIRVLIRSCVILNMVVVFVRVLCQYLVLAVCRNGERWKDSIVLEKRRLDYWDGLYLFFFASFSSILIRCSLL